MGRSWRIARIAGIDVSLHWTFGLLLLWVLFAASTGAGIGHGIGEVLFVLSLFSCVLLHELGHAMAARWYGIPTHGITLLPIGGIAQLERMPRRPSQELVIALAGPAVNVFLAGALLPLVIAVQGLAGLAPSLGIGGGWLGRLLMVNVGLVVFNLLPAFPMDGGRVLRATLASFTNYLTATRWAKRLGQVVAGLFFVGGLMTGAPTLLLVGVFVFFVAEAEYRMVRDEFRPETRFSREVGTSAHDCQRRPDGVIVGELIGRPHDWRQRPERNSAYPQTVPRTEWVVISYPSCHSRPVG